MLDISGEVFGDLTVLRVTEDRNSRGQVMWELLCKCGNTCIASATDLKRGRIYLKKDVDYIKSFKHMIGVECFIGGFYHYVGDGSISLLTVKNHLEYMLFYDGDSNELTYKEYMMLYYPEYEFIWKEQLIEN